MSTRTPVSSAIPGPLFTRADFGADLVWSTATAAYQIEGATDRDGRGPSIWDTFSKQKGKIKTGEHADTACSSTTATSPICGCTKP